MFEIRSFRIAQAIGKSGEKPGVVISWFFPELDKVMQCFLMLEAKS